MPHDKILASFLALGVLTACTTLPGSSGDPATGGVTLEFRPRFKDGGYATQATLERNSEDVIHHLTVTLQRKAPAEEAAAVLVIPQENAWDPIRFSNLKRNSTYWLDAKVYKAADETVPANLISEPASMSIGVDVDDEDLTMGDGYLEIQLKDVLFNGSGEASLNVTEGDYMTPGSATITIGNE